MTNEQIENFLTPETFSKSVNIYFKSRNSIQGFFLNTGDYKDLAAKNFWRVVPVAKFEEWKKTRNINLARIFNGSDFTRLKL